MVEAKPDTDPLSEGVAQASNGLGIYAIDMASGGRVLGHVPQQPAWCRSPREP